MIVSLATPTAVVLSHWMGVRDWGHPILARAWRSGIISLAILKRPASSASAADDMTVLMIWAIVRTGPLWAGTSTSSESII